MQTILLIESHADTRELYTEYLSSVGFSVQAAESTADRAAQRVRADAVIVSVGRYNADDRLQFVRALRQQPRGERLAIVAVSTGAFPSDALAAHDAGCDVFLPMPCMPADLACEVHHAILLRRRARGRALRPAS